MCVVLHHTLISEPIYSLSYELCLAAFFFVSGMFAPTQGNWSTFLQKRTRQLLLPYLIFGLLAYAVWWIIGRKTGADSDSSIPWWQPLWGLLIGTRDSLTSYRPLWFLPCLFLVENFVFLVHRLTPNEWIQGGLIVGMMIVGFILSHYCATLPWGLNPALVMTGIYWLGLWFIKHWEKRLQKTPLFVLILTIGLLMGLFALLYTLNPHTEISQSQFGNPFLFILNTIVVALLWSFCGIWIERSGRPLPVLLLFGNSTLIIMGLHIHCFSLIKAIATYLLHYDLSVFAQDGIKWLMWGITMVLLYPICYYFQELKKHAK